MTTPRRKKRALFGRDEQVETLLDTFRGLDHQKAPSNANGFSSTRTTLPSDSQPLPAVPSRVCLVHGEAGSGKTELIWTCVNEFKQELQRQDAFQFISGKYDQFQGVSQAYSAILDALDELGKNILNSKEWRQQQGQQDTEGNGGPPSIRQKIEEALEFEGTLLTRLGIPSFTKLARDATADYFTDDDNQSNSTAEDVQSASSSATFLARERLAVALLSFLKAFTSTIQPIVLFLDDIQWLDPHSQDLLMTLLEDEELHNFLLVLAYREGDTTSRMGPMIHRVQEWGAKRQLQQEQRQPNDQRSTPLEPQQQQQQPPRLVDIETSNLDLGIVQELLCSRLLKPGKSNTIQHGNNTMPREILALAKVVHDKTNGNPYFVLQQIKQLHAQNVLRYNEQLEKWEWDMANVMAQTDLTNNVLDLIKSRLHLLDDQSQHLLQMAACLGFFVDLEVLEMVYSKSSTVSTGKQQQLGFQGAIQAAMDASFVEIIGQEEKEMRFSHDRIQQCLMVELDEAKEQMHFNLGGQLKIRYSQLAKGNRHGSTDFNVISATAKYLFLAADQLNLASGLMQTDHGHLEMIQINFEASKLAKLQGAAQSSSNYLRKAREFVKPAFWNFHYELILDVYNISAEMEFSLGRQDESDKLVSIIKQHVSGEADSLRADLIAFQTLGARRKFMEAIEAGRSILRSLGDPIPRASLWAVMMEYFKARRDMKGWSDDELLNLPANDSFRTKTILKVLTMGSVYGWNAASTYAPLLFLRSIRVLVRDGSSESKAYALAAYGFILAEFGHVEEAFRFGQLSVQVTKENKAALPASSILTYTACMHLQRPISAALEPFLTSYRIGLELGDLFYGTINLACYCLIYVSCGLPLKPFASDIRNFAKQLRICRQELPLAFLCPCYQLAINLSGLSDNPLDLTREAIERHQEFFSNNLLLNRDDPPVLCMQYMACFNAYILEDVDLVEARLKDVYTCKKQRIGTTHVINYFFVFVDGLAGAMLVEKKNSSFGKRAFNKAIKTFKAWSKHRPINCITPLACLEAERKAQSKSSTKEDVKQAFDDVISQFSRQGLTHYSAIASELAGKYMLKKDDKFWAKHYLVEAVKQWEEYDAAVKVEMITLDHGDLVAVGATLLKSESTRISIQGRSRFDVSQDLVSSTN